MNKLYLLLIGIFLIVGIVNASDGYKKLDYKQIHNNKEVMLGDLDLVHSCLKINFGHSMEPLFFVGNTICENTYYSKDYSLLKVGDIVTYQRLSDKKLVTHRIIELYPNNKRFVGLQGDNNVGKEYILTKQLKGIVKEIRYT